MSEIIGYNKLLDKDIATINEIKNAEIELGELWKRIVGSDNHICDKRWAAIAKTHFEEGFSALVRSIAKPEERF